MVKRIVAVAVGLVVALVLAQPAQAKPHRDCFKWNGRVICLVVPVQTVSGKVTLPGDPW